MKRKIIIGLAAYSALFFFTGIYIIYTIQVGTARLDDLIRLHQVEILREHFLLQIKRVQSDLALRNTRHSRRFETVVTDVRNMEQVVGACFRCHHTEEVQAGLVDLHRLADRYKDALSTVLTIRANAERLAEEEDSAFRAGEELTTRVREMVALTSSKLNQKTEVALQEISRSKRVLYTLFTVGPLLAIGLAVVFIRGFTRPVQKLLDATRTLKSGNLDHRVEGLEQEFGELADSFNEMALSLKEQMRKMQRTEQLAAFGELAAGLAHEIKNPLAGIKVTMNVLLSENSLPPEDREVLGRVVLEVERTESLIRSFLNFAKPPKPTLDVVNVNHLLETSLAFFQRHRKLVREPDEGVVEIQRAFHPLPDTMADPMQLQQVCLNLFLNAIDAMPGGGVLRVATSLEGNPGKIRIDVSDTGKGIDGAIRDRIFEPFFTTKSKGTGLGLPICRQLVEQHGGTIAAEENPGGGTRFVVRLPVRSAAVAGMT